DDLAVGEREGDGAQGGPRLAEGGHEGVAAGGRERLVRVEDGHALAPLPVVVVVGDGAQRLVRGLRAVVGGVGRRGVERLGGRGRGEGRVAALLAAAPAAEAAGEPGEDEKERERDG